MLHLTRISPKPQRVTSLARQIQNSRNYAQHVTTTSKIQTFNCIQPQTPRTPIAPSITRPFTTTPSLQKKKDKNNDSKKAASEDDDTSPKKNKKKESEPATSDDPLDLQELNKGIENAVRRLSDDVSKLSVGGRFNTEAIESLRVHLVKGSKESVRLGELAQLIPKGGRMVTVLVFEEEVSRIKAEKKLLRFQSIPILCTRALTELDKTYSNNVGINIAYKTHRLSHSLI